MKRSFTARLMCLALILPMARIAAVQSASSAAPNNNSASIPQGTILVAELVKSIDAKRARNGDAVKARIAQDVVAKGQIAIPRGSKLIGRIARVKTNGQDTPKSALELVFEQVTLRGGQELNCKAVLQALAPPIEGADVLSSSSSAYGGGNAGGVQPVSRGAGRDLVDDPRQWNNHTRSDALDKAADPATYGIAQNQLRNGFLGAGNRGVFGMPGVSLITHPNGGSTELVSTKTDIKLEDGTQIVVIVAPGR